MSGSSKKIRGFAAQGVVLWSVLFLLGSFVLSRSHSAIATWVEPVRAEIPGWVWVGLGLPTADALTDYALLVEPDVLLAAQLMSPSSEADRAPNGDWWFPARFAVDGKTYSVEAQLRGRVDQPGNQEGVRVRFLGRDRPSGVRELVLQPATPARDIRDLVAGEAARDAGLLAVPTGFARLQINGAAPQIVFWREGNSAAMLQRLGFPEGEVFRLAPGDARGHSEARLPHHYVSTIERSPARAQAAALRRFVKLIRTGNDDRFQREIGNVVHVDHVLAWSAISSLFGQPEDVPAPDWYFDPISGLLEPVVRSLTPGTSTAQNGDAQRLVARLLELPDRRAQHAAMIREWVGVTRSPQLETADARLGYWASKLAASGALLERATELAHLADVRRSTRQRLATHADTLRREVAFGSFDASPAAPAADAAPEPGRVASWIEESGLPFETRADALVLPSGTHRIHQTLVVPASLRLVIEPGATLLMGPGVSLMTFRRLEALGTEDAPIEIRGLSPNEPWGSIGVARASESSELAYVIVSGGSSAKLDGIEFAGELAFNASDVVIRDSDVRDAHGDDGMSVRRGFFQVARSRFIDNVSDGFDAEWSSGSIEQSLFANNGDDGLDLGTSEVRVHRGWFRRMGDKAVSAGERSRVLLSDSQLLDSQIAIASKEDSHVEVRRSEFRRNEIGISLYRDNLVFGSGFGSVSGGLFAENLRDFAVETGSGLTLNGVERLDSGAAGLVIGLRDTPDSALSTLQ